MSYTRVDIGELCHDYQLSPTKAAQLNVRVMGEWVRPASPIDQLVLPFSEAAMPEDDRCFLEA